MSTEFTIRPVTEDERSAFGRSAATAFNDDYHEEIANHARLVLEFDRTLAVFGPNGGDPVATALTLTRDLTVPGAVVPAGHVTGVGVVPTYRRRGLFTRLMHRQLHDIRAAGEPLAVLWPSEDVLYGRFGYGPAATAIDVECDVRQVRLTTAPGPGPLRAVPLSDAKDGLAAIFEQARVDRPGVSSRPGRWWEYRLADPEIERRGASALRCLVYDGDNGPEGYALWRPTPERDITGPNHMLTVEELVALNLPAYLALWHFLLSLDMVRRLRFPVAAVDEPLFHLVASPSQLRRRLDRNLWLRLVDVPAALAARRYAAPIDVVLEVDDPILKDNAGRWRLQGDADGATCERTDAQPDITLAVAELSTVYLGGTSLATLAHAGRVQTHDFAALARASVAFGWHRAPLSIEMF